METGFTTGIFTISLDFELIWGTLDKPKHRHFRRLCAIEREVVIDRLLDLFTEYRVSATWCTVGRLFLECPDGEPGIFHGRDLITKIRNCAIKQDIGSHSFTHRIFTDPQCTRAIAEEELASSVEAARDMGLRMTSFIYPRNRIGHLDLLPKYGFKCFRGQDQCWHERSAKRCLIHRLGHVIDIAAMTRPNTVVPLWREEGIWEIPGSMLYTPSHGVRRLVPVWSRVRRAGKGLRNAVESRRIFHLWFHPTDVVVRKEAMLDGLRSILKKAGELRDSGRLTILNMSQITEMMENRRQPRAKSLVAEEVRG